MMRGDQLTVAHLLSFLSARGHDVDLMTLDIDGDMSPAQAAWLAQTCRRVDIYPQTRLAKLIGLALGTLRCSPLQVSMFRNRALKRDLHDRVSNGDYDIVYCYYPRTSPAIPHKSVLPGHTRSFLALQLSQTLNSRRTAQNERHLVRKCVFWIEAALMGRFESRVWQRFDRTVLIGPADVEAVKATGRTHRQPEISNWIFGAHGTDTGKYVPALPDEIIPGRIVFSGSMLYPPNIQAVEWFAEHAFPLIRSAVPEAEFVIQGRDPSPRVQALNEIPGVTVTGTVPDVGAIIRTASVCVNPMLSAGGMQNKLIEYMASAKAVVASPVANEGIRAPADALVEAPLTKEFAGQVIALLQDPARAGRLGARAREYVLENWTWEKHFLDLEQAYFDALDQPKSG